MGLAAAVSGSAGFGHDYAVAAKISHRRTIRVTLVAVVVILLAVYRTPVAPLVPLGAISLAAVVALKGLTLATHLGLNVGTAEEIFVFVLLYGAGVDYTMLLVSRYREMLTEGARPDRAAAGALTISFPAILASACTVTVGLAMMSFARYSIFRTAGPAVALALAVAMLASVTLAPALLGILGAWLFWPARPGSAAPTGPSPRSRQLWPLVARAVTARPILVMAITVAAFAAPAVAGPERHVGLRHAGLDPRLRAGRSGRGGQGADDGPAALVGWPDRPGGRADPGRQARVGRRSGTRRSAGSAKQSWRCRTSATSAASPPRWAPRPRPAANLLAKTVGGAVAGPEYLSADGTTTRLSVLLDRPALTLEAMEALTAVRRDRAAGPRRR